MPIRSPVLPPARLSSYAALVLLLLTAAPIAAASASSPPTSPPGPMLAPTAAARALDTWRHVRGLDGVQGAIPRPIPEPAQTLGGGNPDDAQWQAGFGLPLPSSFITTLAPLGDVLVVGGYFSRIGDVEARGVATWDGVRWSSLGDFPGAYVQDLAPYDGGLLALVNAAVVWHWDGTSWSALPPFPIESGSCPSYSFAMAVEDRKVAVSLATWTEGIGYRGRVFLLGDNSWAPLGGHFDETPSALAWYQDRLYAGGGFGTLDGAALPTIAVWNGTAWESIADGLTDAPPGMVSQLAVYGGELIACGWFDYERHFARWNGTGWASLGVDVLNANVQRMRVMGSDLYALGRFQSPEPCGIARWDGTQWHLGEDHLRMMAWDITSFGGEVYVGGALSADGPAVSAPLARLRSGRWEPPITPTEGTQGLMGWDGPHVRVIAPVDGGIVAGGRLDFAGAPGGWVPFTGTVRWDGSRWSAFGDRSWDEMELTDLTWHQGVLYASGYFQSGGNYPSVARFEGDRWVPMSDSGILNAYCLASAFGNLFLGGGLWVGATGGVARWDGSAWHDVGGGMTKGNYITSMTAHGDELIVGGDFTEMGGVPCRYIAAWNPREGWRPVGDGLDGVVSDLISRDGVLYASMLCAPRGLARWSDGRWEKLESPSSVYTLGWYRGRLLASSDGFSGWVAYRDGAGAWRPLGSGLDCTAQSFVEQGQSLFVGGFFSRAGGKPSYGFAEWRGPLPGDPGPEPILSPVPVATLQRVVADPNPSSQAVHLRYDLSVRGWAKIEIYDLAGHLVATPFEGEQSAGPQDVVWAPENGQVRAGVYFARVTAADTKRVVRLVRID